MSNVTPTKLIVLTSGTAPSNQEGKRVFLLQADGTPFTPLTTPAEAQDDFVGADLAAVKVELNDFLDKLRAAGLVASS